MHLGVAAFQMEKRGIRTERGNINREIEVTNQKLRQLKARISKLQSWLKEEAANTEPPTLAEVIQGILSRREQTGKPGCYTAVNNLKAAAKMLSFLQENQIVDMDGLTEKMAGMFGEQREISEKLKPIDRRLKTLDGHISNAEKYLKYREVYGKYRRQPPKKGVMNGRTGIPLKAWKAEQEKLTAERKELSRRYLALKDEVKEAERIRKGVYAILREENRKEQPTHK